MAWHIKTLEFIKHSIARSSYFCEQERIEEIVNEWIIIFRWQLHKINNRKWDEVNNSSYKEKLDFKYICVIWEIYIFLIDFLSFYIILYFRFK